MALDTSPSAGNLTSVPGGRLLLNGGASRATDGVRVARPALKNPAVLQPVSLLVIGKESSVRYRFLTPVFKRIHRGCTRFYLLACGPGPC